MFWYLSLCSLQLHEFLVQLFSVCVDAREALLDCMY